MSQSTLDVLMIMRQRNYENLCLFIKWLTSTLIYGCFWLKKHPAVLDKSGAPDVTGAGTQAFIDAFWKQQDRKDFIANMIRDGADLLMNWLKPDDFESKLWGSMLQHPSPTVQNTQQLLSSLQTLLHSAQPTPQRCTRYYNDLVQKPSESTGKPLAADTHRNCLAEAKTFLSWCVDQKWLQTNPLRGVRGVGRRRHGKEQLTIDEARRWLNVALELAPTEDGAIAAALLLLCGLRSSEVVERVVRDVDDRGRVLRIPFGKTLAAARVVALPSKLQPHITALCIGKAPNALLFGQHWRDWPRHWVQRICELAKCPNVCAHSMRGLHATLALQAGQTPHVVAATLGHESTTTTLQSYAAAGSAEAGSSVRALQALEGDEDDLSRACPGQPSPPSPDTKKPA